MSTATDPAGSPGTDPAGTTAAPPSENRAETNAAIRGLVDATQLERGVADELIDRGATVDQARADLFDRLVKRTGTPIRHQRVEQGVSHEDPAKLVLRMAGALYCRLTGTKPADDERPYMNLRTMDMVRIMLEARGERGLSLLGPDELLQRAMHTTGDFPQLLTGTGNRVLMGAFQAASSPLKLLARQTTIADFRAKTTIKVSGMGALTKVGESGEIKSTTRAEAKEAYRLATFARIFSLSRQAVINDDLGGLQDFSAAAGRAAAETEASELLALLTANSGNGATLDDTNPLFHSSHGNKAASGGAIAVATLSAARKAMREQKDLDGTTPINVVPKYLLVSTAKETLAEQVLASLYAAAIADVNPFSGKLQLLVEPRLGGNPWWVFADAAQAPVLEYAYLSSAQGPQIASREGWDTLGMEFRVVLDFGCGVVDHRGAYLDPGA